jgi:hypothetical protein
MNAQLTNQDTTNRYQFDITFDSIDYEVVIHVNSKGKFIDEEISYKNGPELEHEGEEGDIRECIIEHLDQEWDNLVK